MTRVISYEPLLFLKYGQLLSPCFWWSYSLMGVGRINQVAEDFTCLFWACKCSKDLSSRHSQRPAGRGCGSILLVPKKVPSILRQRQNPISIELFSLETILIISTCKLKTQNQSFLHFPFGCLKIGISKDCHLILRWPLTLTKPAEGLYQKCTRWLGPILLAFKYIDIFFLLRDIATSG